MGFADIGNTACDSDYYWVWFIGSHPSMTRCNIPQPATNKLYLTMKKQCKAKTKVGEQCKQPAAIDGYCLAHWNRLMHDRIQKERKEWNGPG
jgi:hypothetical protein